MHLFQKILDGKTDLTAAEAAYWCRNSKAVLASPNTTGAHQAATLGAVRRVCRRAQGLSPDERGER